MAAVRFFLRGKVANKEQTIWIKFQDGKIDLRAPIPFLTCTINDWKSGKCKSPSKKMNFKDSETINVQLAKIENIVLEDYKDSKPELELKEWLKNILDPRESKDSESIYPDNVIDFCDVYISVKENHVSKATIKKVGVVKNLLTRFVADRKTARFRKLRFIDLDNNFRDTFIKYCESEQYSMATTFRNLKFIKMITKVAESLDVEINKHTIAWAFELEKATKDNPKGIYLTLEDLEKIEKTDMPTDYLDNARDWLFIACNTGQRVSDFMRFSSLMIIEDSDGRKFIEFVQQKTSLKMRLPLLKKVLEILSKRDGEFPRQISEVKFNLYIKKVCEISQLNEQVFNGKTQTFKNSKGENITRKIYDIYPKHELVTSHIGRKSFATNFYEKIPTAYLLNFTGHTTEKQFLTYINKTDLEKSKSTAEIFSKLGY